MAFYTPAYIGPGGWTGVDLTAGPVRLDGGGRTDRPELLPRRPEAARIADCAPGRHLASLIGSAAAIHVAKVTDRDLTDESDLQPSIGEQVQRPAFSSCPVPHR
jgi:hypothetical protein